MIEEEISQQQKTKEEDEDENVLKPSDLNFEKIPPDCPRIQLTEDQKLAIARELSPLQKIIHYIFWCKTKCNNFSFDKNEDNKGSFYPFLSILTADMITIFREDRRIKSSRNSMSNLSEQNEQSATQDDLDNGKQDYRFKIKKIAKFYLKDLKRIGYSKDFDVLINAVNDDSKKFNLQFKRDDKGYNLAFAQCIYRDYSINFSVLKGGNFVQVLSNDINKYFPDITVTLSPSQRFQFFYYAKCIEHGTEYNHEVVQYIHSLVLLGMPIVDLSKLPLSNQKDSSKALKPIFEALSNQDFVCGICCTKSLQPDLMENIKGIFHKSSKMRLLHLDDCHIKSGLKDLERNIKKRDPSQICYWNLRKNSDIKNLSSFLDILNKTEENRLLFLDLSYCDLDEKFMIKLYQILGNFPSLQQLHIAGSPNTKGIKSAFDNLLQTYQSKSKDGQLNLRALDLSEIENIEDYLSIMNGYDIPLVSLKISGLQISNDASQELVTFIKRSKTLRTLDVSDKKCKEPIYIIEIIKAIGKNRDLKNFNLIMNNVELQGGKWIRVFASLLYTDLNKWNSFSLDNNNMDEEDLKNLNSFFSNMENLHSISMNNNFDYNMPGIEIILCETLAAVKNLRKLSIAGGKEHQLGNKVNNLLKKLSETSVTDIDLSYNKAGLDLVANKPDEEFYKEFGKIIQAKSTENKHPFSRISIDGNCLPSIKKLEEIISIVKDSNSVIQFDFPLNDCNEILEKSKNKRQLREQISQAKMDLVDAINLNRTRKRMFPDLPFKTTPEMRQLIWQMMKQMFDNMVKKNPLKHSLFCEEMGLPLPYQKMGETLKSGETSNDREIEEKYKCYHSAFISKTITEKPKYSFFQESDDKNVKSKDLMLMASDTEFSMSEDETEEEDRKEGEKESPKDISFEMLNENQDKKDESKEDDKTDSYNNQDDEEEKPKKQEPSDDSEEDKKKKSEKEKPQSRKPGGKKEDGGKDDEDETNEKLKKGKKDEESKKQSSKEKKKKSDEDENDDDSDENDKKRRKKPESDKHTKPSSSRRQSQEKKKESDEDDDDDSDENDRKRRRKQESDKHTKPSSSRRQSRGRNDDTDDDDDDDDSDENDRKRRRKSKGDEHTKPLSSRRRSRGRNDDTDDDDDDDDDDENRRNRRRTSSPSRRRSQGRKDDTDDDNDEDSSERGENRNRRRNSRPESNRSSSRRRSQGRNNDSDDDDDDDNNDNERRRSMRHNKDDARRSSKRNQNQEDSEDERPQSAAKNNSEKKRMRNVELESNKEEDVSSSNEQEEAEQNVRTYLDEEENAKDAKFGGDDLDSIVKNNSYDLNIPKANLSRARKAKQPARQRPPPPVRNSNRK